MDHGRRDLLKLAALTTLVGCAHVPLQPSQASPRDRKTAMLFQRLLTLRLTTAATQDIGAVPYGQRVTFPIIGGSFEGARLRGEVLSGGDDWTVKRSDGVLELDARLTLQTEDGVLIHTTFDGIRDDAAPGAPYFRTRFRFETADPKYAFLNHLLAVGSGEIRADGPVHVVEEIL